MSARLASQQGISFTEFTYQLLQAYDFLTLHRNLGCTVQLGGSDQWGNIIAGIELINRANAVPDGVTEKGFGITTPLLTTASGQKFGKSAGNAISLNEEDTSVFEFYQVRNILCGECVAWTHLVHIISVLPEVFRRGRREVPEDVHTIAP